MAMQTIAQGRTGIPFTDTDIQDNVLKVNRPVSVTEAIDIGGVRRISPNLLKLHAASGGFNTVVEFSENTCLRWFRHATPSNDYVVPLLEFELQKLVSDSPDSAILASLLDAVEAARSTQYYLGIRWRPVNLRLTATKEFSVTYEGTLALLEPAPQPSSAQASPWGKVQDNLAPKRIFGAIKAQLRCPYRVRSEPARLRAWVTTDIDTAAVEIEPVAADIAPLVDEYVVRRTGPGPSLFAYIVNVQDIRIAPTLSLVGYDTAFKVTTLPHFEALAFAVSDGSRQALAVCFDCAPGCKGTIELVQHVIGDADYGVITDELVVESLFLHKWQRGGFLRTLSFYNPITVDMSDGSQQSAHVGGRMTLDSLDAARIDIDANREIDHILIGGNATVTPDYLYLQDGRRIPASEVGLDEPISTTWSVFTDLTIKPAYSSDAQMRAFQVRAYLDAYRFVCKPFASLPSDMLVAPRYVRVDGIGRRVLFLANLTSPF